MYKKSCSLNRDCKPKIYIGVTIPFMDISDIRKRDGDPNIYYLPSVKILTSCKELKTASNLRLKIENSEM